MVSSSPIRPSPDGVLVDVWVVPGSSRPGVGGLHGGAVRVRVTAPPEGGKANRAVGRVLAKATGARSAVLVRGATARRKTYLLVGITIDEVTSALLV